MAPEEAIDELEPTAMGSQAENTYRINAVASLFLGGNILKMNKAN